MPRSSLRKPSVPPAPRSKPRARSRAARLLLLVGTRKGAFLYRSDPARARWSLSGPHFLGHIIHHVVLDPRDHRTMLIAAKTGHLGPTVYHSKDCGRTWQESTRPPAFPKAADGSSGEAVDHVFWLTPGHASQPGVWYAGTSPQALFRSEDGGVTWAGVRGFNEHPLRRDWIGPQGVGGTPDGPKMHSILVDPRDARHLYLAMSGGGVFESTDEGATWQPLNRGHVADFMPEKYPEFGQDPHCVALHPHQPDRLYMQSHCGIYRIDRPADTWVRIGENMPRAIGDIGFPVVLHPRDPNTAWVFPMDGSDVWPRVSPGGKPAVYRTRDAGKTWQRQDRGLPRKHAYFTVKRQCFAADAETPVGLYFGNTQGEVWHSLDEGRSWSVLAAWLPQIYSVTTGITDS